MSTTIERYSDDQAKLALARVQRQVSGEIASTSAPTSGLMDGTARERRDRRILARALKGITAQHGVTLGQAVREVEKEPRPVAVVTAADDIEPADIPPPTGPAADIEDVPTKVVRLVASPKAAVLFTVRGHHFASSDPRNAVNEHVCRGCGASGRFGYVLDRRPCAAPYLGTVRSVWTEAA